LSAKAEEYPCYGKDIVAIADGVVVKVSNNHPDSRVDGKKIYCDTWEQRGNHIVIRHNDSEYSLTAHLMPKSITVKVGDKVKQGEVIAKCGNSGVSTAPHIHFQLQSSASAFTAISLPIAFTNINAQDSASYKEFCEATSRPLPKAGENIEIMGSKTYIGRGLDVENATEQ
jgi:murein DD-endopeptidase MepM/ murein hydrolase activator NlpD